MADIPDKGRVTDVRRHPRVRLPDDFHATVRDADGNESDVTVADLSAGGAGLLADGSFDNDAFVELHMEGLDTPVPGRVRRTFASGFGMEFDLQEPARTEEMEEALKAFRLAVASERE